MRTLAVITAVLLTGCALFKGTPNKQTVDKPATAEAQKVATQALDRALQPTSQPKEITNALTAMNGISKLNISEDDAKSSRSINADTIETVTIVAAVGLAISFLAFFFGQYVGISKVASVASSALCLSVAVAAPAILRALVTNAAQVVIISCFAILGLSAALSAAWLAIDKARDYAKRTR